MASTQEAEARMYGCKERRNFARIPVVIDLPNLIEVQQKSYARFCSKTVPLGP